ncbi:Pseudouridine kinase [Sporomusa rhizae]|uniref:carbohydrate kinase family protein n=1 Tax=Sporomusa rhizae TaxID=357999 RepID=UPI00352A300C
MISTAVVMGTVFMDCKGFAGQDYNPIGRNLGSIKFVHGGVGRNVAENLANLQVPTAFIATVDNSAIGQEVICRLQNVGIDTKYMVEVDRGMGFWLAVLNEKGDLVGSISQMPELTAMEELIWEKGLEIVQHSTHVILELDLNIDLTQRIVFLAKEHGRPVYGIPGNLEVVLSNRKILRELECFICNDIEAERLLGVPLQGRPVEEMRRELAAFTMSNGLGSMVITLGSKGSIYFDARNGQSGFQPVFPVEVVDSSGAGDAFFSGTVMGLIRQNSLAEAVRHGTKVAAWTIESSENTCTDLAKKIKTDEFFYKAAYQTRSPEEKNIC